ncbi:hypothetical protein HMPREF2905_00780 [Staphylococcus sp. HMSC078E07]|uniref:tail assembly chaperone n=1 Tax=Staphylococcus hominis TaxID=1290 RepID=UPI0008A66596|nr:hypothetical protein HMPREF2672_07215 [Staphylococcus sp. HMSC068D07]OFR11573.1 hypothetical protein HMPREF2905_00780 [Staphylococcus sp. HMSC078E07]
MTNTLNINGKDYTAKGSIAFVREAKQFAETTEKDGVKTKGDGVTGIFLGLIQQDPEKLSQFWYCAVSNLTKEKPSLIEVESAIEKYAEENGEIDSLFKGALNTLRNDGMVKGKVNNLIDTMYQNRKGKEKELDTFNQMYKNVTGENLFNKAE